MRAAATKSTATDMDGFVEDSASRALRGGEGMSYYVKLRSHREHSSASIAERRACACNLCTTGGLQACLEYVYLGTQIPKIIRHRSFFTAGLRFKPSPRKSRARAQSFSLATTPFSRRVFR